MGKWIELQGYMVNLNAFATIMRALDNQDPRYPFCIILDGSFKQVFKYMTEKKRDDIYNKIYNKLYRE